MDSIMLFREYTRELERNLDNLNETDCCRGDFNTLQCFLIVEIGRKPGTCVKELAEKLKTDKSAVSRGTEELVRKGFVSREPSKTDRRSVVLELTPEGRKRFDKIENDMNDKFSVVFERIDKDKRGTVLEALKIYNQAFMELKGNEGDKGCQCSK